MIRLACKALVKLLFATGRFPCACVTSSTHGLGISRAALTVHPSFKKHPPHLHIFHGLFVDLARLSHLQTTPSNRVGVDHEDGEIAMNSFVINPFDGAGCRWFVCFTTTVLLW
jgi:hypothetical protein